MKFLWNNLKAEVGNIVIEKARHHSMGSPYLAEDFQVVSFITKKGPHPALSQTESLGPDDKWYKVKLYREKDNIEGTYVVINTEAYLIEPDLAEGIEMGLEY